MKSGVELLPIFCVNKNFAALYERKSLCLQKPEIQMGGAALFGLCKRTPMRTGKYASVFLNQTNSNIFIDFFNLKFQFSKNF